MVDLTTPVRIPAWPEKIRYGDTLWMIGSCFTEHMGGRLERYLYPTRINPFGILYNPVAIARAVTRIADRQVYTQDDLVRKDGLWHSMDHHGAYSGTDARRTAERINAALLEAHNALAACQAIFISPGTAYAYKLKSTGQIVGNCHKLPGEHFLRERLSTEECTAALLDAYRALRSLNPTAIVCWTVSPVRHLRDGLLENQRSKAILLLSLEEVMSRHPETVYFPAYELLHDELRDYRFYDRDLVHPSPLALEIIWQRFAETVLHPDDRVHHPAIAQLRQAMAHRFLHETPEGRRAFAAGQLARVDALARILPMCDWQPLRLHFFRLTEPD